LAKRRSFSYPVFLLLNAMSVGTMQTFRNMEAAEISSGKKLVTRHGYAQALGCDSRTIKRPPDLIVLSSAGREMEVFEFDEAAVAQFLQLREKLLG
jgi:hypothetical protein